MEYAAPNRKESKQCLFEKKYRDILDNITHVIINPCITGYPVGGGW